MMISSECSTQKIKRFHVLASVSVLKEYSPLWRPKQRPPRVKHAQHTRKCWLSAQKNMLDERLKLVNELWTAGIQAEIILKNNPKLLNQFQYCEEHSIPYSVVIGESELQNGVVQLRNTTSREQVECSRATLCDDIKKLCGGESDLATLLKEKCEL